MNKKILIADDHFVVRFGTAIVLENHFKNIVIDYAESYDEVESKLKSEKFDLIILDIDMEGSLFKYMVKELKKIQRDLMILVFSSSDESEAVDYIREGAEGYLNKLGSEKNIIKAVKAIFEDGYYYSPKLAYELASSSSKKQVRDILSEREFQVFKLLSEGNGNLEIANILNIHIATASTYKRRIFTKLNVSNLVDLLKDYRN
ncbi:LuxR family transcriptional regulator [Chryseobacterium sp. Leaf405]|uniref:response regulator transcription factor n=1 Tax=Chryseobacterium sp. Leaf405 TaxID=1736367 RepID=UPI0006F36E0E|nr:response regulator transcription factor [Chryseobacterium sp. Leaf405]KQT33064.1 LuxR family transcriptional regulator [Chryseobacterium sp. Leaf405]